MECQLCNKEVENLIRDNSILICSQCHKKKWSNSERNRLRKKVLKRDNNTCQLCGCQSDFLEVHHKIPVKDGGYTEMENLISLCYECHRTKRHNQKLKYIEINKIELEKENEKCNRINKYFFEKNI
jgi:5-methylcytosine-specific restriction endonuclease McrA